jgi:WD40 repeat protein
MFKFILTCLTCLTLSGLFANNLADTSYLTASIKTAAAVIALDYSPDGKRLVTGGQTNEVLIWEVATGKKLMTLKGHSDNVVAVKYSANGRFIASGGVDNKTILWDAITGDMLYKVATHRDYVRDVAFSPDTKLLADASWDGTANVYNVLSGELVTTITAHLDNVTTVAFNPSGTELLTGSGDKSIRAWDTKTWEQKYILNGHTDEVWDANYSKNGKFVVGSAWDNKARVWELGQKREIYTFSAHTSDVWAGAFSPDNQLVVTGSGDRKVYAWDLATGEMAADLSGTIFTAEVECVSFSPDGKSVAAASRDGYVRIFRTPSVQERKAAYIKKGLEKWGVKGAYEKTSDYQNRLEKQDKQSRNLTTDFERRALDFFAENANWRVMKLQDYNADKEYFTVLSPDLGELIIRVPPKEAENFKENFDQVQVKTPRFIVGNAAIELEVVELVVPRGNEFKSYVMTTAAK